MKTKSIISCILALTMIIGSAAAAVPFGAAEANHAVVTLYNSGNLTAEIDCRVGDIITVSTILNTSAIDDGKISGVTGRQTYSSEALTLIDEVDEDENSIADSENVFPTMGSDAIGHLRNDGELYFIGSKSSKSSPFIFDGSSELIVTTYKVTSAGEASVNTDLITLALSDTYLTKIVANSVVKDGYEFELTSGLKGDTPHSLTYIEEAAPTESTNGNYEYWYCENCGTYFSDAEGKNEIAAEDTIISRQSVIGRTVSPKDEIAVNFYLYIPEYFTGEKKASFTWGADKSADGTIKEVDYHGANYLATCYVAARYMTDKVHLSFTADGKEILTDDYSVADYAVSAAKTYPDDSKLHELLCYMLEYGASVQRYFGYKTDGDTADIADSYISDIDSYWESKREVAPDELTNDTQLAGTDLSAYGLNYEGSALSTTSKTTIRLYFTVTDEDAISGAKVYVDGAESRLIDNQTGTLKYIEISGISAKNIFKTYSIGFEAGADSIEYKYNAASYYNPVLSGTSYTDSHKAVVRAIYNYSKSAEKYL